MAFNELFQWDAHCLLHGARPVDVAADAVELGAAIVGPAKAGEPIRAPAEDGGGAGQGLHIVDGGGAACRGCRGTTADDERQCNLHGQ